MVLFEHDAQGLTRRVNEFLKIAAKHGFATMLCPLDDCEFSGKEAHAGPQPEPVEGLHNSQAVGSPGRRIVCDPSQWHRVEKYVRYVARTWGKDKRILLLDVYNEPGNPYIYSKEGTHVYEDEKLFDECAYSLMEKVFEWVRLERPSVPLTASAWHMPDPFFDTSDVIPLGHRIDQRAMQLSDVISIHAYCEPMRLQSILTDIARFGKPILLTEWMARQISSTFDTSLPTLKELKVGAYQWGLVKGKSQTWLPWPHIAHKYENDPTWWHDVLDAEGNFHSEKEAEVFRSVLYPRSRTISSGALLSELVSENMDAAHSSQHLFGILQNENADNTAEESTIEQPSETVIPSVCSISMAAINSMAAAAANEMMDQSQSTMEYNPMSTPTFGAHMASPTIEGLDLEV
jgi:hypothetical protein